MDNKFEMALVNWLKTLNKKKENFCEKFVFEENVCFDILIQEWIMSERLIIDLPITLVDWLMILNGKKENFSDKLFFGESSLIRYRLFYFFDILYSP